MEQFPWTHISVVTDHGSQTEQQFRQILTEHLNEDNRALVESIRKTLRQPYYRVPDICYENREEYRKFIHERFQAFLKLGFLKVRDLREAPDRFLSALEAVAYYDMSFVAKLAIHFQLFGGSVLCLGNEQQHQQYLDDVDAGRLVGCFMLTELGHGSNVRRLETIAEEEGEEYVLSTPREESYKCWIGGAAQFATHAIIFAHLRPTLSPSSPSSSSPPPPPPPPPPSSSTTSSSEERTAEKENPWNGPPEEGERGWWPPRFIKERGPSFPLLFGSGTTASIEAERRLKQQDASPPPQLAAFVVQIRREGRLVDGLSVVDIGLKTGWNAVDNGVVKLDRVRVHKSQRLNGELKDLLAQLVVGRLLYVAGPLMYLREGLAIAVRYAFQRSQFGDGQLSKNKVVPRPEKKVYDKRGEWCYAPAPRTHELRLLHYTSHHLPLMSALSRLFAYQFALLRLRHRLVSSPAAFASAHAEVSGLKAVCSSYVVETLGRLRPLCGALGIAASSRLGYLRSELDIFVTAEGDNVVLLQQLAAAELKTYARSLSSSSLPSLLAREKLNSLVDWWGSGATETVTLLSSSYQKNLLDRRAELLRGKCAYKLQMSQVSFELSTFDSWNVSLPSLLALARAVVSSNSFDAFDSAVERYRSSYLKVHRRNVFYHRPRQFDLKFDTFEDKRDDYDFSEEGYGENQEEAKKLAPFVRVYKILKLIRELFGLTEIVDDIGFFLMHGLVTAESAKALSGLVPVLTKKLKKFSLIIVNSFDIDDEFLLSPIGLSNLDYVKNFLSRL